MNKIIAIFGVAILFVGCGKKSDPVAPPVTPVQPTIISGTVVDSSGSPIDSVAIKVRYYFAPVEKKTSKAEPCSMAYFTASRITGGVRLNWQTVWETNSGHWEIERSDTSDTSYQKIATVLSAGTTNITMDYSYSDTTESAFQADFYRLCLVDINGDKYYYGPVGIGPVPIYHDGFTACYPCPVITNTFFDFSLACSSQTNLAVKQKSAIVKTLMDQLLQEGSHSVIWNGNDANGIPASSGYYLSECTMSRNDSVIKFSEPLFINIEDISSARVNDYTDAQGAFAINDIPVDSTFTCKDEIGNVLKTSRVCDSVTVYAIKSGYPERSTTFTFGRNTTSTIKFVLK
jgi:hypothetical protein